MAEHTAIAWCHHSWNPWWGCTKIAAPNGGRSACDFCYASAFAKRTGHEIWGKDAPRRFFGDKHWAEPVKWNRRAEEAGERRRVFCASMADVFEDRRDLDDSRVRLFDLIERTPNLDWLLLTKRPEQMNRFASSHWINGRGWPTNVWAGTTVEDQRCADLRVPRLLAVDAATRFLSAEPLLGPVVLDEAWLSDGIDWVIVGGESGPGRQELDLDHARSLRDQCAEAGVAYFFKQTSALRPGQPGPDDLMVRQFPHPVETAVDN